MAVSATQRKLAAVLSADVAGYSRLMGANEEDTLQRLKEYRTVFVDRLAQHRGRLVNTQGDALLAEFDSVVDAVSYASQIQRELAERNAPLPEARRMLFRIGINLGDVMVDGGDLFGDGVNIAARLQTLAESGGICISGTAFDQVEGKMPLRFQSLGEQHVKNITKPVRAYAVRATAAPAARRKWRFRPALPKRGLLAAAALALVAVLAGGGWLAWNRWQSRAAIGTAGPQGGGLAAGRPSIAVLPFQNMSGDPGQEYFSDGITEDIITDLSKHAGLFVIARNSTFTYKGKAVDVTQVGRELGVKFLLEGSVQKSANKVRINAQLIDAETGGHLWAERYDGSMTDIFALQDQVGKKIVTALAANLSAAQQSLAARKEHTRPEAYEAYLKGMDHLHRQRLDDYLQAIAFFNKATTIDPGYSRAYAALAATYWEVFRTYRSMLLGMGPHEASARAEEFLEKALRTPTPLAYQVAAGVAMFHRRYDDALDAAERSMALDPNDPDGYVALADVLSLAGRPEEALRNVERAMQLNPYYPPSYLYQLGLARFGLRQYPQAADALERAIALNPEDRWSSRLLMAADGHLGRADRAAALIKSAAASWLGQDPLTVRAISFWYPFKRAEDADALAQGLSKAGLSD